MVMRRAMVLVDALVATVLLGVSLASVMGMIGIATRAQRQGERMEIAAMLLDEQLSLVVARGADQYAQRFGLQGRCDAPFQDYTYELEITGGSGEAFLVTATVYWIEEGRRRSESVQTMVAPRLGDEPDPVRKPEESVLRL